MMYILLCICTIQVYIIITIIIVVMHAVLPGMVGWQQKDGATSNTRAICVINKIEDNKIHKIQI